MVRNDCIDSICSSLEVLGQQKLSDDIRSAAQGSRVGLDDLAACFNSFAAKYSNERFDRYFRRAKVGTPCYIDDILDVPERKLDKEYIQDLNTLQFVFKHHNLVVWGPPGTGKTWLSKMIATSACAKGLRTRWVTFPVLYDQLLRLYKSTDGQTLDSKLAYYSRFDLLCIDEFPNVSDIDPFLVQQMFNTFSEKATSLLVCMQIQPEKMDELFPIRGIGQSVKGRILQKAKRIHLQGPDLRLLSCD